MAIDVRNRREPLWDDFLVEKDKTTAALTLHPMTKKEKVLTLNMQSCAYGSLVCLDGLYRFYYTGKMVTNPDGPLRRTLCCIESRDGLRWEMPRAGVCEYLGTKDNNTLLIQSDPGELDNLFIFYDENPACPPCERFKGVGMIEDNRKPFPANRELWCYISEDGLRFTRGWKMTDGTVKNGGIFDSLNTAHWDGEKYLCFVRGIHGNGPVRDIRMIESADFKTWSEPRLLRFGEAEDYPLYTNGVSRYYRARHILTGFPTRYVQKPAWTQSFDHIGGKPAAGARRELMAKDEPRSGLALTDCVFMTSRDGISWHRFDEAFLTPGPENPINWIYGDCYPWVGMIETPAEAPDVTGELSMYMTSGHRTGREALLYRYAIRIDGFASYHAGYQPCELVTKPLIFSGTGLEINFRTSARGSLFIRLLNEDYTPIDGYESCEIFGDSICRPVDFPSGAPLSALSGRPVRMRVSLRDADLYSFCFR